MHPQSPTPPPHEKPEPSWNKANKSHVPSFTAQKEVKVASQKGAPTARCLQRRPEAMPSPPQRSESFATFKDALDESCGRINSQEEEEPLSWRLDPEMSLSDWTIIVSTDNKGDEPKTYHVHKIILSVGPCKSDYFARLFRNQTIESSTSTSKITMGEAAANAFEHMLDFQYNGKTKVSIENAAALRYLSQYFGIRKLFTLVTAFIRINMNVKTAPRYLMEAAIFHDEHLMSRAAETCAQNLSTIDRNVLTNMDAELFLQVLAAPKVNCTSEELSSIVAYFCHEHENELNGALLSKLTETLSSVDKDVSLYLLELSVARRKDSKDSKEGLERLRDLCIQSSSQSWRQTLVSQFERRGTPKRKIRGEQSEGCYAQLPPSVKVELLENALSAAKEHAEARDAEYRTLEQRYRSLEQRNTSFQQRYMSLKNSMKKEQKTLKDELERFRRVPVSHSFQNKSASTYQQQDATNKFYGRKRPTCMPTRVNANEDGYIITQGDKRWPVFYYKDG